MDFNRDSPMPLWYQLKQIILDNIESGRYKQDEPLPSEKQLCKEYDVSVITVRKAMDELVNENILVKRQGKGTFLKSKKFQRELNTFHGFSEDIERQGSQPVREIISFSKELPSDNIARKLNIKNTEHIYNIITLNHADSVPVIISKFYLPADIVEGLKPENLEKDSIYKILQVNYDIKLLKEIWTIEAISLDEYESGLLNVAVNSSALLHTAISYNLNNEVVMFSKGILRGDRCKFITVLSDEKSRQNSLTLSI